MKYVSTQIRALLKFQPCVQSFLTLERLTK